MESGRRGVVHFESRDHFAPHFSHRLHTWPKAIMPQGWVSRHGKGKKVEMGDDRSTHSRIASEKPLQEIAAVHTSTCGENEGSLPQPRVHTVASYREVYNAMSNQHSAESECAGASLGFGPCSHLNSVWLHAHHCHGTTAALPSLRWATPRVEVIPKVLWWRNCTRIGNSLWLGVASAPAGWPQGAQKTS